MQPLIPAQPLTMPPLPVSAVAPDTGGQLPVVPAMPVPEPVPEVVIRILGWSAPYATCQELISGSSSVLPVSLTVVFPEDEAAEDDDGEPELVHAATIAASGMSTAAASGRRIRL